MQLHVRSGAMLAIGATTIVLTLSVIVPHAQQPGSASASANMAISAQVVRKCTIAAQPLSFGSYDPVQTNSTAPLDGQTTVTVACTKGTAISIAMDSGANGQGRARRLSGTSDFLTYELYQDSSRAQTWGDAGGALVNGGVAPSRDPRQFVAYGRIPGGQDITEGQYQDTIVVTVQF